MKDKENLFLNITMVLGIIGGFLSLIVPFFGITFLGGSIATSAVMRNKSKEAQHMFVASIVCGISCVVLIVATLLG